jgi:hypothetical protein
MTPPDFTEKFVGFVWVFANLLVCAFASQLYQRTSRRSALLLAVAAALGAIHSLLPWIRPTSSSWGYWYLINFMNLVDAGLWLVGSWLLFREFGDLYRKFAQPNAAPNGGPAASVDKSNAPGGPPSVS